MKTKLNLFLIASGLMIGACSDDETTTGINLDMKAVSSLSTIKNTGARAAATGIEFTEITLGVKEVEFETQEEDDLENSSGVEDESDKIEFEGPYLVDLIKGVSTPDFGVGMVVPGAYTQIEIEMGPVLPDGSTLRLAFNYNGKSYVFSTTEEIEMELENLDGYQLDANAVANLLVLVNLDTLFSSIDLNTATAGTDGVIRINNSSNSEIHNQILAGIEESCEAGEDDNGDDSID